jgi:Smg protein
MGRPTDCVRLFTTMFEVLVYLFENYYQSESYPDHSTLSRKLTAAGFENDDISEALDWLNGLNHLSDHPLPVSFDSRSSHRTFVDTELSKLSLESRGFLMFLESAGVLTPVLREMIIERAMALEDDVVGLERFKVIALLVLWTRHGSVDTLVLDELLPDGEKRLMH